MLNYKVVNNNHNDRWLVLFHGFGGSNESWEGQLPDLTDYNLVMIELPFHGQSTEFKMNFKVRCLNNAIKAILDKENIKSADFAGISLGTMVVANFTKQYPQYVKKILLVGSAVEVSFLLKAVAVVLYTLRKKLPYKQLCHIAVFAVEPSNENKEDRESIVGGLTAMSKEQMISWVEYIGSTIFSTNLIHCLKEKHKDFLFISGIYDTFFLTGAKKTAKTLSSKTIQILQGCSHICNADNPKQFNKLMVSFLAQ